MLEEIDTKLRRAREALKQLHYVAENVSAKEFHDYMTGEIFSDDKITLRGVLNSGFLMVHELVEMSELKRMGRAIDKRIIMESPKAMIYKAHFMAMEYALNYALLKTNHSWIKTRLEQHKRVLADDPHLPEKLKPRAQAILERFEKLATNCV